MDYIYNKTEYQKIVSNTTNNFWSNLVLGAQFYNYSQGS